MADGRFLVKFIGEDGEVKEFRCHIISFDYDVWTYKLNNE